VLIVGIASFPGAVSAHQARAWSTNGVDALRAAAARDPRARVLADDRHSDFVLWESPGLAGRLIADVRFELLDRGELTGLARFERGPAPHDPGSARLVVLDPKQQALGPWRRLGWKVLYADPSMSVLER
jgi:hypothetical protein